MPRRLSFLLLTLSFSSLAFATPDYPGVLDRTLEISCPNPSSRCMICHTSAAGGKTTATQPFALSLRRYGLLRGGDPGALSGAVARLPDGVDSDLDGAGDKLELENCLNPSGDESGVEPVYGCGGAHLAAGATTRPENAGSTALLLAMGLLLATSRSRGRAART